MSKARFSHHAFQAMDKLFSLPVLLLIFWTLAMPMLAHGEVITKLGLPVA